MVQEAPVENTTCGCRYLLEISLDSVQSIHRPAQDDLQRHLVRLLRFMSEAAATVLRGMEQDLKNEF